MLKRRKSMGAKLASFYERALLLMTSFMMAPSVFAADEGDAVKVVSATEVLKNIASQLPSLMRMVTAVAYVMGLYFIMMGILKLKQYGEQRSMMSSEHSMKGTIVYLIIGAMLIYLPSAVNMGLSTFWTTPNPYGYLEKSSQWTPLIKDCFMVVQLFGTIAFIRGLVILSKLGHQGGGGHDSFGKGMTHIVGGILCLNIYQFVQVILNTMGVEISGFNS